MHIPIEPSILYFGTPVILISTLNEDGTSNVAPMSSAWWLGWNGVLGLGMSGQTAANLLREKEAVLNLPSVAQVDAVNRLAKTTGTYPVPDWKHSVGYRHEKEKLRIGKLSEGAAEKVKARRVNECPIQLEAVLEAYWPISKRPDGTPAVSAFHMKIVRVHAEESLLVKDEDNHIDPGAWRPLIMSFCQFYGLSERVHYSTLAEIPQTAYRPAAHMSR